MKGSREQQDQEILLAYEEVGEILKKLEEKEGFDENASYYTRLKLIKDQIATERRLIEEISLPCRFILEHFSLFLGKFDYTLGFKCGKIQAGRGLLSAITVEEWGNIRLSLGSIELSWRDADYQYMFYPDKVILRPNDISKGEIYLYFSYAFKYSDLLKQYQDVADDPQTSYWHEDLVC